MAEPLTLRFATDNAGAKSGMQDLAAAVLSSMVKISGTVTSHSEASKAAFGKVTDAFGTGATGIKRAATTIVSDVGSIGAAGIKAANDTNYSAVAIAGAVTKAAVTSQTAGVAARAGWGAASAAVSAHVAVLRNEMAGAASVISNSPALKIAGILAASAISAKILFDITEAGARLAAEQVERLAKIGNDAQRVGVSSDFLQSLTNQARGLRIEAEDVLKTLERLKAVSVLKADIDGGKGVYRSEIEGTLRDHAKVGNVSLDDVTKTIVAPSTEARFRVLLELMQRLIGEGKEAAALEIGSKFLDPKLIDRIRDNSVELDKLVTIANNLNQEGIFSKGDIERSVELSRRLSEARDKLDRGLKPIYEDLARMSYNFHLSNVEWVEYLSKNIPTIVAAYKQLKATLDTLLAWNPITAPQYRALRSLTADADPPKATPTGDPDMDRARNELARRMNPTAIATQQRESIAISKAVNPDRSAPTDKKKEKEPAVESLDEVERLVKAMEKAADTAEAERRTVGLTNVEREKALALAKLTTAAREAGREATEEEKNKVVQLAEATARVKDRTLDATQAIEHAAEAMRTFGQMGADAFADMVLEGKSFNDVLGSMAKQLAKMAINAAFTGTGPLAGLFGTAAPASAPAGTGGGIFGMIGTLAKAFAGGFADGGTVPSGQWAVVGERGPELLRPSSSPRIVVPSVSAPAGGGGGSAGGSTNVNSRMAISINLEGANGDAAIAEAAQAAAMQGAKAALAQMRREVPRIANAVYLDRGRAW